ncbi:uncharacterized protein LOC117296574 [Asterias rubens]|uniref:uncharacterized protein LOC117296574 n=1 Tax=Asterias rubens TaxID=7604 RepID=UPI0014558C87|nr:uncharacterized protein LOC117296574 [Asterias rubens]
MDRPEHSQTESLLTAQRNFEKRFSCPICLEPRLKMVVSSCQHRICAECLYDKQNKLYKAMAKCPTCLRENVYPAERPDIPEDNIEIQRQLGVTQCPLDGCDVGLWIWDVEKHIESCSYAVVSPKPGSKRKRVQKAITQKDLPISPKYKHPKQEPSSQSESPVNKTPLQQTTNKVENKISLRPRPQVRNTPPNNRCNRPRELLPSPRDFHCNPARDWSPRGQIFNRENLDATNRYQYLLRSHQMQGQPFPFPVYRP